MTKQEAIDVLIDLASRWAENMEEGFAARIDKDDDDDTLVDKLGLQLDDPDLDDAKQVRDCWRAVYLLGQPNRKA